MERDEVIEVNLVDMLCMLCRHWKSIICVAIVGAALAVGIGTLELKNQEETVDAESTEVILEEELLTSYKNRIAVNWEQYKICNTYLEKSPLQKFNAEEVFQQTNLYAVSVEDMEQAAYRVALLQEAYQDMASDYKLYDAIRNIMDIDTEIQFLGELVGIEQKRMAEPSIYAGMSDSTYQVPDSAPGVLSIRVLGRTRQECNEMSKAVDEVLQTYYAALCGQIGEHTLEKLATSTRTIRKPDIVQTRVDMQKEMGENLKTIEDLEKKITSLEETLQKQDTEKEPKKILNPKLLFVLGILLGAIAGCAYWGIHYLFDGKMHNTELLYYVSDKSGYGLSAFSQKKKSWLEKLFIRFGTERLPVREIDELIALAEKEMQLVQGNEKPFAIISSMQTAEYEVFSAKLREIGQKHNMELHFYAGDAYSAECLEVISEAQGVIWMEQKDASKNEQIRKIGELCRQHEVPVIMNLCIL